MVLRRVDVVPSVDVGRILHFHEGVPDNFANAGNRTCLIILDDLLNVACSGEVCKLFTKGSHHRNISVNLITQNLFHQAKYCKDISLNAKYIVLLKNTRDKNQFTHLERQVYPEDSACPFKAYLEVTEKPQGTPLVRICARYGRQAAVSNQHITGREATLILFSLD